MEEREEVLQVSNAYRMFWENTVIALEKVLYDEKHNPVWKNRGLFLLDFSGNEPLLKCKSNSFDSNSILFRYIKAVLHKEIVTTWSQRAILSFAELNNSGKPITPDEMAFILYNMACTAILDDYSVILGVSLRTVVELANLGYEKSDFDGTKLVFDFPVGAGKNVMRFSEIPFSDENLRAIRKVSAGVGKDLALYISVSHNNLKVPSCQGYCATSEEDLRTYPILVTLWGKREWSLSMYGVELFRVIGWQIRATEPVFRESQAVKRLKEELKEFPLTISEKFDLLLDALHKQKHGTSVIFSTFSTPFVREYLARLEEVGRARALLGFHIVEKSEEELDVLTSMARIDGAFVVDLEADQAVLKREINPANKCSVYTGVLLDSKAESQGFSGHGARANSVLAFVQETMRQVNDHSFKIGALVFSEDGYVLPILGSESLNY